MKKAFPDWLLGVSFAATWTWAVACLVGISILQERGIIPFAIWFVANTSAIPIFGWVSFKYPGLWNQTRRPFMRVLMTIMLLFTAWINMTGILTAGETSGIVTGLSAKILPVAIMLIVWAFTFSGGIRWSVMSDRVQWTLELGSMLLIVGITIFQNRGIVVSPGIQMGSYTDWTAYLFSLWTITMLIANPFLDGTFWHRAAYAKSMRPYWWGWAMFMVYLVSVAITGLAGLSTLTSSILFGVIFFASFSTLDSCSAALQLTAGKRPGQILGGLAAFGWIPIAALGLLNIWVALLSWLPILGILLGVTYYLEKKGKLAPVPEEAVAARDALPVIESTVETVPVSQ